MNTELNHEHLISDLCVSRRLDDESVSGRVVWDGGGGGVDLVEVIDMTGEACPSCGEAWAGECPKDTWYKVYTCDNCGRVEGEYYGEYETIRDGKELSQQQWEEMARLKAEWEEQAEEEDRDVE